MAEKQILPCGLWPSPVKPALLGAQIALSDVQFDSDGQTLVWHERRSGRGVLAARRGEDAPRDLTDDLSVHAGVGYGGGDFTVGHGLIVFVSGGRLYRQSLDYGRPQPITPAFGEVAAAVISPDGSRLLFVHSYERADCLGMVDIEGRQWPLKLASGADFYMQPAWHPDGQRIAWIEWDHPQMPWDGTRLMIARIDGRALSEVHCAAGDAETPIFQPAFSPDGRWLAYIAQDGEWDRLCVMDVARGERRVLVEGAALSEPAWTQGLRTYAWSASSARIFYLRNERGTRSLWAVEIESGKSERLATGPYTWMEQLAASPIAERLAFIGSSAALTPRLVTWEAGGMQIQRRAGSETLAAEDLSVPRPIEWQAPDGMTVHGLYYAPTSAQFAAGELPPAIVNVHGGPTSARVANFNNNAAFFATRGYAYLEVNYRGSTGYGRSYMLALRNKWGLLDVEDAVGGAQALADQGLADPKRMVIMGGSAGGYTVLNALIHHPGFFKAGVNLFGVANLLIWETHKFEERYNDTLVGILPRDAGRFRQWSPVFHADKIRDPLAVFQGAEDKVVPREHSDQIVATLRANNVPHIYKVYEGEGHGWRKSETIEDYYSTVEKFLQQYVLSS